MHGKKLLTQPVNLVLVYDGSFDGFLCCVHHCVYTHQMPAAIVAQQDMQPTLLDCAEIDTDAEKAARVLASIPRRISDEAAETVQAVFLSCLPEKELALLRFLLLGYQEGSKTTNMLGHPDVAAVLHAQRHLGGEAHLLKGFVRFSDYGGVLAATITPKNFVLPFIASHFISRYSQENFMIYDKTHKAALIYENKEHRIVHLDSIEFPAVSEEEQQYRALWKQFYHTIAIEARYNPKCRMTHMPKRYWENMTEMAELL